MAVFSEPAFYSAFKVIRNRYRKYKPGQLVSASLEYLRHPTKDTVEELQKQPWLVLLLLKWILVDEQFEDPLKENLPRGEFSQILQMVLDLASKNRMPSEYPHYSLFFRNLAYQQFLYQVDFSLSAFARQSLLFCRLPDNHTFKRDFESITGVRIDQFVELAFMLLVRFITETQHFVPSNWFTSVSQHFSEPTVKSFFSHLAADVRSLRQYLLTTELRKASKAYEYYEETPFIRYPLIRSQRGYESWYLTVLYRGLEYFIYDTLRAADANNFMSRFGPIFEKYVEGTIVYLGMPFATEAQLSAALPGQGKVVDFVLVDDDINIFIDAKGVEMSYLGKVSHRPDIISDKLKESAIKGIRQGFDTAKRLAEKGPVTSTIRPAKENYLLVVTYKELYLGSGSELYDTIAKERLGALLTEYGGKAWIPLKNIYFLTIDDLDRLTEAVKSGQMTIIGILRKAVSEDKTPSTKTFIFGQRIPGFKSRKALPKFLEMEFQRITNSIESYFLDSSK